MTENYVKSQVVLFTGGGTGGHIYPAISVAENLRQRYPNFRIIFCGTSTGLEADVVPRSGFEFLAVEAEPLPTRPSWRMFKAIRKLYRGYKQSEKLLADFKPLVVVGTGGFVSTPLLSAAAKHQVTFVIHEQNAYPGRSNRFLSGKAAAICLGFIEAKKYFKNNSNIYFTGNPVKADFMRTDLKSAKKTAKEKLGLPADRPVILISGGSLGAKSLNVATWEWFLQYRQKLATGNNQRLVQQRPIVILATGSRGYQAMQTLSADEDLADILQIKPYLHDMVTYMQASDLIIGRAGAITCAEILALGKPSVLIPYPYAAGDHQRHNAEALVSAGASLCYSDDEWTGSKMAQVLDSWFQEPELWAGRAENALLTAQKTAATDIVDIVLAASERKTR